MRRFFGLAFLGAYDLLRPVVNRLDSWRRNSTPRSPRRSSVGGTRPRVLVVSPYSIHPPIHGGAVRIVNLLRQMSAWADVSVFIHIGGSDDPVQRRSLEQICERVFFQQLSADFKMKPDPFRLDPPSVRKFNSDIIGARLEALVEAHGYDIVHLEYTEMAAYIEACRKAKTVLVEHDVSFVSHRRQRALKIGERFSGSDVIGVGRADDLRQKCFELRACARADQVHFMSEADRARIATKSIDPNSGRFHVIANGVDTTTYTYSPNAPRHDVLFVGSFPHLPNLDAFETLVHEVWPQVRQLENDARLTVAGARPPTSVVEWDGQDGITVLGEVPDLTPLYQSHRVLLVPIRAGSGTRLKVLEALACGLPVVSTPVGVEGIELSGQPEVCVASSTQAMAEETVALLRATPREIESLGSRGRSLVQEKYGWDIVGKQLHAAHEKLCPASVSGSADDSQNLKTRDERDPKISVLVIPGPIGADPQQLVQRIKEQETSCSFEILYVNMQLAVDFASAVQDSGARLVQFDQTTYDQGRMINIAAATARGDVLAVVSDRALPVDELWLDRLTIPLFAENPPSAVAGGVKFQPFRESGRFDTNFTQESRAWREAHGGLMFSVFNAAIRRDVWENFPLPSGQILLGCRWQQMVEANGHLILPCWAAEVSDLDPPCGFELFQSAVQEGREWERLGTSYRFRDLLSDVLAPRAFSDESGDARRPLGRTELIAHLGFGLPRPLGLFIGNTSAFRAVARKH